MKEIVMPRIKEAGKLSDKGQHKECGGYVYVFHRRDGYFLYCQKCGEMTGIYDSCSKVDKAWYEMVESQENEDRGKGGVVT